jgi:hypothetical protein
MPMTDHPKDPAVESPIARALRMKKAALETKSKPAGGGRFTPRAAAGMSAGASKPAMKGK